VSLETRVTKLEARTGGGDEFPPGPVIQRPGETVIEAARRCGYSEAMIARGGFIVLPDNGRGDYEPISTD